ncbi:MAG: hypothetical protein K2M95_04595 [Clostridiales bacterium]|nr:hypothetical protein [Clostridiales bacterium]
MWIDLERNFQYYNSEESMPCNCEICKNYYDKVKDKYPEVAAYLASLNVDILRPFELIWFDNDKKNQIEYIGCQYIVFGKCDKPFKKKIGSIMFERNVNHHPSTNHLPGNHFVLDFGKIVLEYK